MDLWVGMANLIESLQIRIKEQTYKCNITLAVYCRLPDQEEQLDEALYRQQEITLHSQALVLIGDHYLLKGQHSKA